MNNSIPILNLKLKQASEIGISNNPGHIGIIGNIWQLDTCGYISQLGRYSYGVSWESEHISAVGFTINAIGMVGIIG